MNSAQTVLNLWTFHLMWGNVDLKKPQRTIMTLRKCNVQIRSAGNRRLKGTWTEARKLEVQSWHDMSFLSPNYWVEADTLRPGLLRCELFQRCKCSPGNSARKHLAADLHMWQRCQLEPNSNYGSPHSRNTWWAKPFTYFILLQKLLHRKSIP